VCQLNPAATTAFELVVVDWQFSVPAPEAVKTVAHADAALNLIVPDELALGHVARNAVMRKPRRMKKSVSLLAHESLPLLTPPIEFALMVADVGTALIDDALCGITDSVPFTGLRRGVHNHVQNFVPRCACGQQTANESAKLCGSEF
jgi:hypothetical protein